MNDLGKDRQRDTKSMYINNFSKYVEQKARDELICVLNSTF